MTTQKKKKPGRKSRLEKAKQEHEVVVLAKYRRTLGRNQDPSYQDLVEKILTFRNGGMTGSQISQLLNIDRGVIYSGTCSLNVYLTPQEKAEILLSAMSLGKTEAEYVAQCHSEYGVGYCQKHGDKTRVAEMLAVANGEDI